MPDINIIEITASAGASSIVVDPSGAMLYAAQAAESAATAADLASGLKGYGAVMNGTTDDTGAVLDAIAAVGTGYRRPARRLGDAVCRHDGRGYDADRHDRDHVARRHADRYPSVVRRDGRLTR